MNFLEVRREKLSEADTLNLPGSEMWLCWSLGLLLFRCFLVVFGVFLLFFIVLLIIISVSYDL